MRLFRISIFADLQGLGGEISDGRWHTRRAGRRIVYLADHPALALLEVFVNFKRLSDMPDNYQLLSVHISDSQIRDLDEKHRDAISVTGAGRTQAIGNAWLEARESVALRVPSVIVPFAWNCLLNPLHPAAEKLKLEVHGRYPFDPRLRK